MTPATIIELRDVTGNPKVKLDLPSPMRLADKIQLNFRLARQHAGRSEVLDVVGEFHVTSVSFDLTAGPARQVLVVASKTGVTPSWRAVKKSTTTPRKLGPAKAPPQALE